MQTINLYIIFSSTQEVQTDRSKGGGHLLNILIFLNTGCI